MKLRGVRKTRKEMRPKGGRVLMWHGVCRGRGHCWSIPRYAYLCIPTPFVGSREVVADCSKAEFI